MDKTTLPFCPRYHNPNVTIMELYNAVKEIRRLCVKFTDSDDMAGFDFAHAFDYEFNWLISVCDKVLNNIEINPSPPWH